MSARTPLRALLLAALAATALPAAASELAYTFIDFHVLDHDIGVTGSQSPVPEQDVTLSLGGGDGIAGSGAIAIRQFYLFGAFKSSIIDVTGTVTSPLATTPVSGNFDLVQTSAGVGYQREISRNFDVIGELSYEVADYDFGSFAGENFDMDESGVGVRLGFRWNPLPRYEIFAHAHHTPVGRPMLSALRIDSDTVIGGGLRWSFFEDLALGLEHEAGEVKTTTLTLRFNFSNLPW